MLWSRSRGRLFVLMWKSSWTLAVSAVMSMMLMTLSVMVTMAGELARPPCIWTSEPLSKMEPKSDAYGMSSRLTLRPTLSSRRSRNVLVVMAPPNLPSPASFSKHSMRDSVLRVTTLESENHQK